MTQSLDQDAPFIRRTYKKSDEPFDSMSIQSRDGSAAVGDPIMAADRRPMSRRGFLLREIGAAGLSAVSAAVYRAASGEHPGTALRLTLIPIIRAIAP